ncbi:MAG: efflux RND transporter periplasmic adaptor subunit [Planctomycetales bacterium]|nr:efflux RND transporter periplasmic adaptor subunit [Planctomycetales bacterium]
MNSSTRTILRAPGRERQKGWSLGRLSVYGLPVVLLASVAILAGPSMLETTRGWLGNDAPRVLTHAVDQRDLEISVIASGLLSSASSVEVMSEVEGEVAIISVLSRGTRVKAGEVVVQLDSALLKTQRLQQQVALQQAKVATAKAREAEQAATSQGQMEIRAAVLTQNFAKLDLNKYVQGDYPQQKLLLQSEITLADEELKRARERIQHSAELEKLGYLSKGQVDADRLQVLRSQESLTLAKEKFRVLEQFTHVRMLQEMQSKLEEADRNLEYARTLAASRAEQARTQLAAQVATEELEAAKLKHLDDQIAKCTLRAPQDGVVLYPMPEDDEESVIKQGVNVRQLQHVFTIPNTDEMMVRASVHEASVHLVKAGMRTRIVVDSLPDRVFDGVCREISMLPDQQSWRKSTVNFYPADILVEGDIEGLRPGMNAKVTLIVDQVDEALAIPVQSVVREEDSTYCVVMRGRTPEPRPIRLGRSNHEFVEVLNGLRPSELVALSPNELNVQAPLPDESRRLPTSGRDAQRVAAKSSADNQVSVP